MQYSYFDAAYNAPLYLLGAIIFFWLIMLSLRGYEMLVGIPMAFFIIFIAGVMLHEKYILWIHFIILMGSLALNLFRGYFYRKYRFRKVKLISSILLCLFVISSLLGYLFIRDNPAHKWYKSRLDNTKELGRVYQEITAEPAYKLAKEAKFKHIFSGEMHIGWEISFIREQSIFDKIGLKNNDIIKRINTLELPRERNLPGFVVPIAFETAFKSDTLEIEIVRAGRDSTIKINLTPEDRTIINKTYCTEGK